jgi:hypothetical protein
MKRPSEDLFDLVKSLSGAEARQFRSRLRQSEGSNTLKFFEEIWHAESYEEGQIRETCLPQLNDNQFSVAKHYLYQALLNFLLDRDRQDGSAWKIRHRLQHLELLYQRELYGQCQRMLKHIDRASKQLDDPMLIHEVCLWKLKLADRLNHEVSAATFAEFAEAFQQNLERIKFQANVQWEYHDFFFRLRKEGVLRQVEQIADAHAAKKVAHEGQEVEFGSLASWLLRQYQQATLAFMTGNQALALAAHQEIIDAMEASPGWISLNPDLYLDSIFRVGVLKLAANQYGEAEASLEKMSQLKRKHEVLAGKLFFYQTQLKRLLWLNTRPIKELGQLVLEFEQTQEQMQHKLSNAEMVTFQFNNAMGLLYGGDHAGTKRRLNDLLQLSHLGQRPEFQMVTRMVLLILAEHDRDHATFQHLIRSVRHQLKQSPEAYLLEREIVLALPGIFRLKKRQQQMEAWRDLEAKLQLGKLLSGRAIQYFDYGSWVKSKLEACTYGEALERRRSG